MSPALRAQKEARRSLIRMVSASFAAGVGVMMLSGFVAPVVAKGALSLREAEASPIVQSQPVIAPLDIAAIEAQLAMADSAMLRAAAATDPALRRLEQLSVR